VALSIHPGGSPTRHSRRAGRQFPREAVERVSTKRTERLVSQSSVQPGPERMSGTPKQMTAEKTSVQTLRFRRLLLQ